MADMLTDGVAWLSRQRREHLSQEVTYSRGQESVELPATPGKTDYEVADEFGAAVAARSVDFIVSAADLVLGGQQILPQIGDRITTADGRVFEPLPIGEACWRPADPGGVTIRIHTKEVET